MLKKMLQYPTKKYPIRTLFRQTISFFTKIADLIFGGRIAGGQFIVIFLQRFKSPLNLIFVNLKSG